MLLCKIWRFLSLPHAFPDRFCYRQNMQALSGGYVSLSHGRTGWWVFAQHFLGGFRPRYLPLCSRWRAFARLPKKKWDGQCWIAVWPTQSDRVVELDTADQWTVELYRVSMVPHCSLDSANQKNEAEGTTFMSPPSGWYPRSLIGHLAIPSPSPFTGSLPSSVASCSAGYLVVWAEPHTVPLHWCPNLWQSFPSWPLLFHVGQTRAPCVPSVKMAVKLGKDQNGSHMIVGQQVAEEEPLALLKRNTYPVANAGVWLISIYFWMSVISNSLIMWFASVRLEH